MYVCIYESRPPPTPSAMSATPLPPPSILYFTDMATNLSEVHQSHANMIKTGLIHSPAAAARLLSSAIAADEPPALAYADSLFARLPAPTSFAWNSMIRAHARAPDPGPALQLFYRMLHSPTRPDNFTFPFILKACAALPALSETLQIHARIIKTGFGSDIFVLNTLLHTYAINGLTEEAFKLFGRMPQKDLISWNALINALVAHGLIDPARNLFDEMPERNVETWNFMISGYLDLGLVDQSRELFNLMPVRDIVSWNAMITGCAHAGRFDEVISLFQEMQYDNVWPDECTLVNVLSACARVGALGQGEWIRSYVDKNGIEIKGFLATAFVDMYSKCGSIEKALQVFSNASKKDVSTWNAMIDGLSSHGFGEHALRLFEDMPRNGLVPNGVTFVNVLSACSHGGLLNEGCRIFDDMACVYGIEPDIEHYGCMVDLLGRAGLLVEAKELLKRAPVKDAPVLWRSLLSACREHGDVELAEIAAKQLLELCPFDSSCYIQLSKIYALLGRWEDARMLREMMKVQGVKKEPGCSTIEVDGAIHEFFVGD
ncbi:pentatricopeptide repeat-containing protein At4g18840 [Elaeis guineensis]|uniref:pentatricopeptide repeat-containing protein At4g18840 n=1 Tax=Elaeis guineensis var. tenera TaxID=51953 RepID=UPI003C6D8EB7